MVDAFLKIDVKEVNDALNIMESRYRTMITRVEESASNMVEIMQINQEQIKLFNSNLGKLEIIKLQLSGEELKQYLDSIKQAHVETTAVMQELGTFVPIFRSISKDVGKITDAIQRLEHLIKSDALKIVVKELKKQ